jgi:glycosyltransferase Alg8
MSLVLYLLALAALAAEAPATVWRPATGVFVILLGLLGAWHYGWGAAHLIRALIYRHRVFPGWRQAAGQIGARGLASEVYVVITSYRISSETTARVYQAAIAEAIRYGRPVTLIAALVELGDQRLIKRLFQRASPPPAVRLMLVRRPGIGQRHGLASALRAISRAHPAADAAVVLLDGDTPMTPGCLGSSLPFLRLRPEADGLVTDEDGMLAKGAVLRAWLELRSAARHQLMSSMALGRRSPAIPGRMSIYRAGVATDPGFIATIESDELEHWRLGRIRLSTEVNQSVWFWLLRGGRTMLYLPDVQVIALAQPRSSWLLPAATRVMLRRFGDRLRTNGRALALGPRRIGWFAWWCLIDQRVSMWSVLGGPVAALIFGLGKSAVFLYVYLLWVGTTRLVQALTLLTARPRINGLYPLLIEFGQVYGALVKTYVLFRPDRQASSRPKLAAAGPPPGRARLDRLGSAYLHVLALCALVAAVTLMTNLLGALPGAGAPF